MNWPKDDPHCGTCGEQIPCSCDPCDIGQCDHKAHCDVCGKGVDVELEDGICMECSIEWQAKGSCGGQNSSGTAVYHNNRYLLAIPVGLEAMSQIITEEGVWTQYSDGTEIFRPHDSAGKSDDGGEGQCEWFDERDRIQNERDKEEQAWAQQQKLQAATDNDQ